MRSDDAVSRIELPPAPEAEQARIDAGSVACWRAPLTIDSYTPAEPDRYPLFLDRRVYQGSSGRVYPMPFIDRIEHEKRPREWDAIHLENRWVRLTLLPELGGRIHIGYDKTRGYDFFYRNNVIKPALVGLAGPWISGGVEFNWPQHHRPATYLPVDTAIERDEEGVTVWHSDLDPLQRMRGAHGIRLTGGSALIELHARLHNRTDEPQTFLWWANVAARVHERYQSFFPTDVGWVADHARRAITSFPAADRPYYGVDYPALAEQRPGADRLDFYSNIPVPTSYMVTGTRDDFFGGYDHDAGAGFVHWADHTIAPGKKQWTWGNGPVGHAWDDHLTDGDGPYVELMAGVFTDNQPDFSYLAPGEVREFRQYWYPIQDIGPAHQATLDAAVSLAVAEGSASVGVAVTAPGQVRIALRRADQEVATWHEDLAPGHPFTGAAGVPVGTAASDLVLTATDTAGRELVRWRPRRAGEVAAPPVVATEPSAPAEMGSADELYRTAVHLLQYRHPTRSPMPYLVELERRDSGDARGQLLLGTLAYRRAEYALAADHLRAALQRSTERNVNPESGETSYRLGLALERLGDTVEARECFAKARWDRAWAHPAELALARLAGARGDAAAALAHAEAAARLEPSSPQPIAIAVIALRALGRTEEAERRMREVLQWDELEPLCRALAGQPVGVDPRTRLTLAFELARAGDLDTALALAAEAGAASPSPFGNPAPVAHYARAAWLDAAGRADEAAQARAAARQADRTYAFPHGLDEHDVLRTALAADPEDPVARALLGVWQLDAGLIDDAAEQLTAAARASADPVVLRNAAVATVNSAGSLEEAERLYARAVDLAAVLGPADERLLYERDQLALLRGVPAEERLRLLEERAPALLRDDLAIAYVELLVDVGRIDEAVRIVSTRRFQPFEGGEGKALAAYDRATLAEARRMLTRDSEAAARRLRDGIVPPRTIGEGRSPAARQSERMLLLGDALLALERRGEARAAWEQACASTAPLAVAPRPADEGDYFAGLASARLGRAAEAEQTWRAMEREADRLLKEGSTVDYFATSLPELLLFSVDTEAMRRTRAERLRELAADGRARTSSERAA